MISLDEMDTMLDEIATSFPQDKTNGLYIMGEYCHDGDMGRYICI